jgi:hypothetical protein
MCVFCRLLLCSVRAPRAGGRDRAPEPHGLEAREFLRKKLIGKDVTVKMEYTRKIGMMPGQAAAAEPAAAAPGADVSELALCMRLCQAEDAVVCAGRGACLPWAVKLAQWLFPAGLWALRRMWRACVQQFAPCAVAAVPVARACRVLC